MTLFLFNTESRKKEELKPIDGKKVRMYTCGPTIYDFAHIGNFRTYVFEDLLRRTIKYFGFEIEQAMNITDLDDKTIKGSIEKNVSLATYTEPYKKAFFEDLKKLNIEEVEHYPAATDFIPEMIEIIEKLLEKKCAYVGANRSIYFSLKTFSTYGRLSRLNLKDLKFNASGENDADEYGKESLTDFVLWKAYEPERDGKVFWESPFGPGRPGWHIECSAMAMKRLGPSIDIHCGGVDNIFPHHENEIAQSESYSGCQFATLWLHAEHLLVDHKKMSKSLGNFYSLRDLLKKGYTGEEVRYLLLSTHYRTQLNFNFDGLQGARAAMTRIGDLVNRLRSIQGDKVYNEVSNLLQKADEGFKRGLADDLNISNSLAAIFDLIRELNVLADQEKISKLEAEIALKQLEEWDQVLGVLPLGQLEEAPVEMQLLLKKREQARKEKNFSLSDQLRDEILAAGYIIEDTPTGTRLKRQG
jgi:cysteinyl-tRNA synthetase